VYAASDLITGQNFVDPGEHVLFHQGQDSACGALGFKCVIDKFAITFCLHQAAIAQAGEVMGCSGLLHPSGRNNLRDVHSPLVSEQGEYLKTLGLRNSLEKYL